MTQQLYTAAEARRIDIERGGEGRIKRGETDDYYIFDEGGLLWKQTRSFISTSTRPMSDFNQVAFLPVTPEPEQPWSDKSQSELRIEQLEKKLAEYKDHYHEILADHGELTQKFDEATKQLKLLKEKQLTKEDFQLIQIGRLILEVNKRAWELREADL